MKTFLLAAGFLTLLVAIGSADSLLNNEEILANISANVPPASTGVTPPPTSRKPDVAVSKAEGPDVEAIIAESGLVAMPSASERSLLAQLGMNAMVETRVLLSDQPDPSIPARAGNDRIGSITWVTDSNVKTIFASLKQALLESFSPDVQGLRDVREEQPGYQARTILAFLDPRLSGERFLIVQSGESIYEMHIVPGKEEVFEGLVDGVTRR